MSAKRHVIVMVRQPRVGRVKTRLARDVGAVEAARAYRVLMQTMTRRLARDERWQTIIAVAGDGAVAQLPGAAQIVAQPNGDIGQRMARLLATRPPGSDAVVVGSDIAAVTAGDVAAAFAALAGNDMVFAPAADGGFWLVGARNARRHLAGVFEGVRWSSPHALDDAMANARRCGHRVALAAMRRDVDTVADYVVWRSAFRGYSIINS